MVGNLELQGACCMAWKRMRQSRPMVTSRWEPQVQGSFTNSIGALFWNPTWLSHWMIRPKAQSRCHWACSYKMLRILYKIARNLEVNMQISIMCTHPIQKHWKSFITKVEGPVLVRVMIRTYEILPCLSWQSPKLVCWASKTYLSFRQVWAPVVSHKHWTYGNYRFNWWHVRMKNGFTIESTY
jgi:hypothetical protein